MSNENLFHAYVVGGARAHAHAFIEELLRPYDILRTGNPDYIVVEQVNFTVDNARELRQWQELTSANGGKKVYVVYTDFITREAENALLKTLEEPVPETHIIFAVPKPDTLLPTLLSRVRVMFPTNSSAKNFDEDKSAEKFLHMNLGNRMAYVAKLIEKSDDDDASAQVREKALAFIDQLEKNLSEKLLQTTSKADQEKIESILKLKRYLFISGASVRIILETIALTLK